MWRDFNPSTSMRSGSLTNRVCRGRRPKTRIEIQELPWAHDPTIIGDEYVDRDAWNEIVLAVLQ